MATCGISKKYIFQEALDHCRWKTVLRNEVLAHPDLQEKKLHQFIDNSFDEILLVVHAICDNVYGIGMLSVYDITSAICRYNKINIDNVYIIGGGPKRAIQLLGIKPKVHKIQHITLKYVEIIEIIKACNDKSYEIPLHVKQSMNGDDFESYICNWQKDK
jgi:hypothetical protein